jgi:predicted ATPase
MQRACMHCGHVTAPPAADCVRCGARLPQVDAALLGALMGPRKFPGDGSIEAAALALRDEVPCPSCKTRNTTSAEYCTACGTPMAIITRVVALSMDNERGPLETWRVYGIETSLWGRSSELDQLAALEQRIARERRTLCVSLTGATGTGKSRLVAEFRRKLDAAFAETIVVSAHSRDVTGGAHGMLAQLLRNRFYIAEQEAPAVARRRFMEAVEAIMGRGADADRVGHALGALIGLEMDGAEKLAGDSDRRGFDAVLDLIRADARRNPLVLVFEDLQDAPEPTLRLIRTLRSQLGDVPVLLLLTWNPDEVQDASLLRELEPDQRLEIAPLTDDEVTGLVREVLERADTIPPALLERIVESAHGNPLAVEEVLRILIADGTIDTRAEPWQIQAHRLKKVRLPTTVEAAVRERLSKLSDVERLVLGMAACVGDAFWPELVLCLWRLHQEQTGARVKYWADDADDERVEQLIESLERKDIVRRRDDTSLPNHAELFFKHRIERKTLYGLLSPTEKQRYHRLIAQWLEARTHGSDGRMAEFVAQHFDQARCLDHAARKYIEAADYARKRYANRRAIELYTRGLGYLSDADMALKVRAFHDLGSVHDLLGEFDQSLGYYRELARYAWMLGDLNKGGVAYNKIGRAWRSLGEFDDAIEALTRGLHLFYEAGDVPGIASTLDDIGKIHWIRGKSNEAFRYYDASLAMRRELGDKRSIALSLNHLGSLHLQRGELKEAMIYFREALELRRQIDDRPGVAESFNNLGILCMERADYAQALTLFGESLQIARELGYRALEGFALNNLGECRLLAGEVAEAAATLEEAYEVAQEAGEKRLLFDILRNRAQTALKYGSRKEALDFIGESMEIADELDSAALKGQGMKTLGDIYRAFIFDPEHGQTSAQGAESAYKEAIEQLKEAGQEAQLGHCYSALGHLQIERGQTLQGKKTLELAAEIFRRLEMRKFWDATERLVSEL